MSNPFSKSDLKVIARDIQDESGMKYTEALRAAETVSRAHAHGTLDMMWDVQSGRVLVQNGSLTPYQASQWIEFLDGLNDAWVAPGTWKLINTGPGWNQFWLLGDEPHEPIGNLYVVTRGDVDWARETLEMDQDASLLTMVPEDDVWDMPRTGFSQFLVIAVDLTDGVQPFVTINPLADEPYGLKGIRQFSEGLLSAS